MPFIPHTEQELRDMLAAIGVDTVEALFDEIPATLRVPALQGVPPGEPEWRVAQLMHERAAVDSTPVCFLGAGAYDHHVPAAVWQVAARGEFYSAYTPYQPEASQGTLQLLYEFQTMVASLMGLDCANASLYDGASALAEAVLMAVRADRGKADAPRIWLPRSLSPRYRRTVHSLVAAQGIAIEEPDFCPEQGRLTVDLLERCGPPPLALAQGAAMQVTRLASDRSDSSPNACPSCTVSASVFVSVPAPTVCICTCPRSTKNMPSANLPSSTITPSATSERAPMKQLSSMMTGLACRGSSTPPMPAPPEICTLAPIWAQLPTVAQVSTMVPLPTRAPMFT